MKRISIGLLAVLLSFACGDDDRAPGLDGIDAGPQIDSGPDDDDPIDPPDGPSDPMGPDIVVVSPGDPDDGDFSSDAIVTSDDLIVICEVTADETTGELVDPTSVKVTVIGTTDIEEINAAPTSTANQFRASADLSNFANGPLTVRCEASDLASTPRSNSEEVETFVDLGPRIDVFNPIIDTSYGGSVAISFTVLPLPVDDADTAGSVVDTDSVTANLSGYDIPLDSPTANVYTATVNFDDPAFDPPLDGAVTLQVSAANERTTSAVTRASSLIFLADNDGPGVTITSPPLGALVSGIVQIGASVDDTAGVTSVVATIDDFEVELVNTGGSAWEALFDTRVLDGVYPLVQVRAIDDVGNEATAGQVIALDNAAPIIDLDPPNVREATCVNPTLVCDAGDIYECTTDFDPLGGDSVSDGQTVPQLSEFRLRAEDRANSAFSTSGVLIPIAHVDSTSVRLLILDDISMPLLVDTDGDGGNVCDAVNPNIEPTTTPTASNQAALIDMQQVPIGGAEDYLPGQSFGLDPEDYDYSCWDPLLAPDATTLPACLTSPLSRIISSAYNDTIPSIFGVPPVGGDVCVGSAIDSLASNISDGWACAAAVVEDNLGNIAISPPMRVCFDFNMDGLDNEGVALSLQDCAAVDGFADPGDRPSCTDGCVAPTSFWDVPERNILYRGVSVRECSDGLDNDEDLDVDWDEGNGDDQCTAPNDEDESTL